MRDQTFEYKAETREPKNVRVGQRIAGAYEVWCTVRELGSMPQEHFCALDLNGRHVLIEKRIIAVGTLNGVETHPRDIFRGAIQNNACAIILAHNHPSQNLEPSTNDIEMTKRIVDVGKLVGIPVLDHVIVGTDGFVSMQHRDVGGFNRP